MQAMFDKKTADLFTPEALDGRSREEIIILASVIEREAHGDDDRATIAGIIEKRLKAHMPLQIDATVAYGAGVPENQLTKDDFLIDSPYNTYKYAGLPPTPISNPGLESLAAALSPKETEYIYYLHDKNGNIHYAKTFAEHEKNVKVFLR
jgi:UPF0755 protein